ncbi:unnamed protein product [Adineta steineri]|uniref:IBR domain-containing protein n=1 Tax=Adineta steineri TaxID=433720 RepID=A0A814G241_9BILA|nr:unnamed protein product [Adineta steineri]
MATYNIKFEPEEYYHYIRVLEADEEFRWCKSIKGCGAGQLVSNHKKLHGYYTCHACSQMMCFHYSVEWHTGYTCKEFEAEQAKNEGFASYIIILTSK